MGPDGIITVQQRDGLGFQASHPSWKSRPCLSSLLSLLLVLANVTAMEGRNMVATTFGMAGRHCVMSRVPSDLH